MMYLMMAFTVFYFLHIAELLRAKMGNGPVKVTAWILIIGDIAGGIIFGGFAAILAIFALAGNMVVFGILIFIAIMIIPVTMFVLAVRYTMNAYRKDLPETTNDVIENNN